MDDATVTNLVASLDDLRDAVNQLSDDRTPGSPAYVRALRDRAAERLMVEHLAQSLPEAKEIRSQNGSVQVEDVLAHFAVRDANALIRALGYKPPREGADAVQD